MFLATANLCVPHNGRLHRLQYQWAMDGFDERCSIASEGVGPPDLRGVRDPDRERRREQGPCAHLSICTTDDGAKRDHEASERTNIEEAI